VVRAAYVTGHKPQTTDHKPKKNMIGIFDSGLGGLTILKEIKKELPEYDYLYFGDTLHVPYGNRSDEAVFELTKNACEYLFDHGCQLIILACNTASARALRRLQQEYLPARRARQAGRARQVSENILGVIGPLAEEIARTGKKKVGVIGTRGTVNSKAYVTEIHKLNPKLSVEQSACPLLVPLIEENWLDRKETKSILRYYLRPLKLKQVETLILGCTHYPMLVKQIKQIMGKSCSVPNPGEIVAASLINYLERHPEIETQLTKKSKRKYVVTDLNENFKQIAGRFLGEKIKVEKVDLK
jgi:glutamate racemase